MKMAGQMKGESSSHDERTLDAQSHSLYTVIKGETMKTQSADTHPDAE